ncbi:MAG: hypothetical protein ABIH46_04735 [Chloroflexota bacterium]
MDKSKLFEVAELTEEEGAELPERQKERFTELKEYAQKHVGELAYLYDAAFGN